MKIVIVGAGEVGFHIASRLAMENKDVVVIDVDSQALTRLSETKLRIIGAKIVRVSKGPR